MNARILTMGMFLGAIAFVFATGPAHAADAKAKTTTVITINGMHCEMCAKKVVTKLEATKHVASVKIDVKSGKATVAPAKGQRVSPKLLWEAVEAANYTPKKLEGPNGTYTKKPQS